MLQNYLQPVALKKIIKPSDLQANQWANKLRIFSKNDFPDLTDVKLALIGLENPKDGNLNLPNPCNRVRKHLYQLYNWEPDFVIADLGNIKRGKGPKDVYFAVQGVVNLLMKKGIIPIFVGDTHDISYGQFRAHTELEKPVNVVVVDQSIDLFSHTNAFNEHSFLYKILMEQPFLSNFTQIGYQRYYVNPSMVDTLEKLHFECYSLGEVRGDMQTIEPLVRNANMLSFDMAAVKAADAPSVRGKATPNGFYGEEACRITRYAGISDHMQSVGFYQYDPMKDTTQQTAQLMAQMIWYFVDGYYNRKNDFPEENAKNCTQYTVSFKDNNYEIVFLKSPKSDRWWMKVPQKNKKNDDEKITFDLIPCSYSEYQIACKNEIPDRWMKALLRNT